jgi:uncharacterized protein DUF72
MAQILIGTSGWHDDSWRGPFLPKELPLNQQLRYYAGQFRTTELNGVFYRTPTLDAVKTWRTQTGNNFVFAWKAPPESEAACRLPARPGASLGHGQQSRESIYGASVRASAEDKAVAQAVYSTETRTTPDRIMPSARAALIDTSITRPRTNGPRSLTRH